MDLGEEVGNGKWRSHQAFLLPLAEFSLCWPGCVSSERWPVHLKASLAWACCSIQGGLGDQSAWERLESPASLKMDSFLPCGPTYWVCKRCCCISPFGIFLTPGWLHACSGNILPLLQRCRSSRASSRSRGIGVKLSNLAYGYYFIREENTPIKSFLISFGMWL